MLWAVGYVYLDRPLNLRPFEFLLSLMGPRVRWLVSWDFILISMWHVGLRMAYARPCARGWKRRRYGPCARGKMRMRQPAGQGHPSQAGACGAPGPQKPPTQRAWTSSCPCSSHWRRRTEPGPGPETRGVPRARQRRGGGAAREGPQRCSARGSPRGGAATHVAGAALRQVLQNHERLLIVAVADDVENTANLWATAARGGVWRAGAAAADARGP